jgi:hypothetical protein
MLQLCFAVSFTCYACTAAAVEASMQPVRSCIAALLTPTSTCADNGLAVVPKMTTGCVMLVLAVGEGLCLLASTSDDTNAC